MRGRNVAQGLPPMLERTVPTYDVGQGEVDNMAIGGSKVVIGRAGTLCVMVLCAILARMASRGTVCRAHSAQMHRIAASTGLSSITGAIMPSSSARRWCEAASSWPRLSSANAGAADAVASRARMAVSFSSANAESADIAARSADK